MGEGTRRDSLERLEASAGLAALLNSIAHEMNNHLTNMVLATENARHDRSESSFDLLGRQLKQCAAMTTAIQRFGSDNLNAGSEVVHLREVLDGVVDWDGFGRAVGVPIALDVTGDPIVRGDFGQLVLAVGLLLRVLPQAGGGPLKCDLRVEDVLRSRWSDEDQYLPMARITVRAEGEDAEAWPPFQLSELVEGFYEGNKSQAEMRVMGAWEIIRKVSGRPSSRLATTPSEAGEPQFQLWLPLAVDWTG